MASVMKSQQLSVTQLASNDCHVNQLFGLHVAGLTCNPAGWLGGGLLPAVKRPSVQSLNRR